MSCADGSHATTIRLLQRLQASTFRTLVGDPMHCERAANVPRRNMHGTTHVARGALAIARPRYITDNQRAESRWPTTPQATCADMFAR